MADEPYAAVDEACAATHDLATTMADLSIGGTFTNFTAMPQELQDEVWASVVSNPGFHYLQLATANRDLPSASIDSNRLSVKLIGQEIERGRKIDVDGEIALEVAFEPMPLTLTVSLIPAERYYGGGKSQFVFKKEILAKIASVHRAATHFIPLLLNPVMAIRVRYRGSLVSLDALNDVMLIDFSLFIPFTRDQTLRVLFDCPQLKEIRKVAIRFDPTWYLNFNMRSVSYRPWPCPVCGLIHADTIPPRPRIVYHFLARHFPTLEEFWIADVLMQQIESSGSSGQREQDMVSTCRRQYTQKYYAFGQTFYEADISHWYVRPGVVCMLEWLRERYIRYNRTSELAVHKAPEKVKFGILGRLKHIGLDRCV